MNDINLIEGVVEGVSFTPGRGDGLLLLDVQGCQGAVPLFTLTEESNLSIDGKKATGAELIGWLLTHEARGILLRRSDRYMAATEAHFEENNK